MIINLKNKGIKIIFENKKVEMPEEILEKIRQNWEKIEQEKSNVWNGQVVCVTDIKYTDTVIELYCKKSDYAHYLYGERIGLPIEYCCRNLSAGCLLETSDGHFVVGELDKLTSYPGMLQIPGGNIDTNEINGNSIDCLQTIIREVKEEIGININDQSQVSSYRVTSIYINEEQEQPGIEVFAIAKLKMDSIQMKEHFSKYYNYLVDNGLEIEFNKIHLIKKDSSTEILNGMNNPKRNYLLPLLEKNSK